MDKNNDIAELATQLAKDYQLDITDVMKDLLDKERDLFDSYIIQGDAHIDLSVKYFSEAAKLLREKYDNDVNDVYNCCGPARLL